MKVHPAAELFPMLTGKDFDELVESIREHGQQVPIVVDGDVLLDGRNRLAACEKLGLEPKVEEWNGKGTPVDFIVAINLKRRHLTQTQRGLLAVQIEEAYTAEAQERMREGAFEGGRGNKKTLAPIGARVSKHDSKALGRAAKAVGIGISSAQRAKRVVNNAPDLAEKLRAGETTIGAAYDEVLRREGKTPFTDKRKAERAKKPKRNGWSLMEQTSVPAPAAEDPRVKPLWEAETMCIRALQMDYGDINSNKRIQTIVDLLRVEITTLTNNKD